jgi:putative DNA primase/helicase
LDAGVPLFVDQFQAPHTLVDGEALPLTSRSYNWLRGLIWKHEGRSVNGEALKTAAGTLAAFADASGDVRELYTRAAYSGGALYYQLGKGRVVQVDKEGWRLVADPPVVFRSIANLKPLPDPERGGGFEALDALVNLKSDRDKRLFRAYAVTLPLEHVQRPILQPTGVMGSGKSTASRAVKRTLDPSAPEAVRFDPRDFIQKASHSFIVMLDNQNSLPEWAVDMLCRLVTGEADSKRKHYTDDDDIIYELKRAVVLNGINAPTDRGDAQDRTLPVELDRIPDDKRRAEEELWEEFEYAHGRVLGAIFDALSRVLKERPGVKLDRRPRLADWGYYAAAAYEVFGWGSKQFEADWKAVVDAQNRETREGSALAQAIFEIMEVHNYYSATPDKLLEALETEAEKLKIDIKRDKKWPNAPS